MKCSKCGKEIKSGTALFEQGNSVGIICHHCKNKVDRK